MMSFRFYVLSLFCFFFFSTAQSMLLPAENGLGTEEKVLEADEDKKLLAELEELKKRQKDPQLQKKERAEIEKLVQNLKMEAFVTHCLLIIAEIRKDEVMFNSMANAFAEKVGFITPARFMRDYLKHKKLELKNFPYRYFQIPRKQKNEDQIELLLCLPASDLGELKIVKEPIVETKPTLLEMKLGLYVEHCMEVISTDSLQGPVAWDVGDGLREVLNTIFVPKNCYVAGGCPRWALVFDGHGAQYELDLLALYVSKRKLFSKEGNISGLSSHAFSHTIADLNAKILIRLIHIATCFGGGINMAHLLRDEGTGQFAPYPFILTTATNTGDSAVRSKDSTAYDQYFEVLRGVSIPSPHTLDTFIKAGTLGSFISPQAWSYFYNAVYVPVYDKLPSALGHITTMNEALCLQIPALKPVEANYFVDLVLPDEKIELFNIDKNALDTVEGLFNALPKKDPANKVVICLRANTVPLTIDVQSAEEAELISAIPGTTFHIIDKIRLKQAVINVMDPILWTARCLFRTMRLEEMPDVRKLVHIKSIEGIPDMQSYEVWLIRDGKEFSMLVVAKKDTDERIRLLYETAEPLTKPKRTTLTEEGVRAWIKEFNKEIVICKRLAYLLEPYRFLKNAEIETEMPDFIEL